MAVPHAHTPIPTRVSGLAGYAGQTEYAGWMGLAMRQAGGEETGVG